MKDSVCRDNNYIEFTDALEQHLFRSDLFFDEELLKLLLKYFSFKYITIAAYDSKFHLLNGIGTSKDINKAGDYYLYNVGGEDSISQYISSNFESIETNEHIFYDSIEDIKENTSNEKLRFFFKNNDLCYRAILPISRLYRISVFKKSMKESFLKKNKDS